MHAELMPVRIFLPLVMGRPPYVSSFFFSVLYSSNSFCRSFSARLVSSTLDLFAICVRGLDASSAGSTSDNGIWAAQRSLQTTLCAYYTLFVGRSKQRELLYCDSPASGPYWRAGLCTCPSAAPTPPPGQSSSQHVRMLEWCAPDASVEATTPAPLSLFSS